jgi:hypothetical protein
MTAKIAIRSTKFWPAGLAALAVLIAAECVRASVGHSDDITGSIAAPTELVAAELDPVFVQKLAYRMRAPYARAHGFGTHGSVLPQ